MPAFTFEKISSPIRSTTTPVAITTTSRPSGSNQVAARKPRGLLLRMLDRFARAPIKRDDSKAHPNAPLKHPPPD